MDICEHYEQKGYKRGNSLKSAKTELKPGSVAGNLKMTRKIIGLKIQTSLNQVWERTVWKFTGFATLRRKMSVTRSSQVNSREHVVVKQRQMINDDREDREANSSGQVLHEGRAAILSFQTGICRTLNVCGSRYLDRRGDHETSKGLSFFRP